MARILIVEDVELVRQSVQAVLEAAGHQVVEATNGEEGLSALEGRGFDLVVADIWMPKVDGIAMLKQIKKIDETLPVIIISGGGQKASLEISASLAETWGADAVLYKPFDDEELVATVGRLIARRAGAGA